MKNILFFLVPFLVFTSCCSNKRPAPIWNMSSSNIKVEIIMRDTYGEQEMDSILLFIKITNESGMPLLFGNPRWWVNSTVLLTDLSNQRVVEGIKVKADLRQRKSTVKLMAGESLVEAFQFPVKRIYSSLSKGDYSMKVVYHGDILSIDNKHITLEKDINVFKKFSIL